MVEDAVVLVVVEDEHGLVPHLRVGRDRVDLAGHEVRPGGGRVVRVLGLVAGRDEPGDGRQLVVDRVVLELARREGPQPARLQRGADRSGLERGEHLQQVALVVVDLLVHLPAHPGLGQRLRVGLPAGTGWGRLLEMIGPPPHARRVDPRGHVVQPVRPGRPEHRAVVVVADGEVLGQREVERDVVALQVAHRVGAVGAVRGQVRGQPVVHLPAVPGRMLHRPGVAGRRLGLGARRPGVQVERQQVAVGVLRVGLVEHRLAVRQRDGLRVGEPPHVRQRAEVVVERAVLLHQDHHVLDVAQASPLGGSRGERAAHVRREELRGERRCHRGACGLQQAAARQLGHWLAPSGRGEQIPPHTLDFAN